MYAYADVFIYIYIYAHTDLEDICTPSKRQLNSETESSWLGQLHLLAAPLPTASFQVDRYYDTCASRESRV